MTNSVETPGPLEDDLAAAMRELNAPKQWVTSPSGESSSTPIPRPQLQPATPVLQLNLDASDEWRVKFIKLDEEHHLKVSKLAQWAEWFIKRASCNQADNGRQLIVTGHTGCGKTHAARQVSRWFGSYSIDLWYTGRWSNPPRLWQCDWPRIAEEPSQETWDDIVREIHESQIVVLDDIGAETDRYRSGQPIDRLRRVISACESKWLFITSNVPRPLWETTWDPRVSSRLMRCHYLDMSDVPDYRPKLRGAP